MSATRAELGCVSPCFIVADVLWSVAFYREGLAFDLRYLAPEEGPFVAIVGRDRAQIFLKAVAEEVRPQPNHGRHRFAPWDAFIYVEEPERLAEEFESRKVPFHKPLTHRHDGVLGFEIADPDGYVLFFGRPEPLPG